MQKLTNINNKIKITIFLGFVFSLHLSLVSFINSTFLSSFIGETSVGIVYALASVSSILALLFIPKILKQLGGYKFILYSSILSALSLFSLYFFHNKVGIVAIFILYFTLNNIIIFIIDELLEIFADNANMGKIRGLYLAFMNSAWVLSQLISSRFLNGYKINNLYFIAFILMIIFFLTILLCMRKMPDPKYDKITIFKSLGKFTKHSNLMRSYLMTFLLQFFFSWMVIYTPIYLSIHLGFSWQEITSIFSIMLLPFVLFQFPLGKYSDKWGERHLLMAGFTIISISTIALFFIKNNSVWVWASMLFITRIGAAIIESMVDIYFFKHINKENDEFIGIYRNTQPMAYIFAPLTASILFYFIPAFNYLYLILGALMLSGIYISSTIKKSEI